MLTVLSEIDHKTPYAFLDQTGAVSIVFKEFKNTKLRKNEVWNESLKNALRHMNWVAVLKIQNISSTIFLKTLQPLICGL